MNTEQLDIWKNNILTSIKEISNLELQKLTWTGKHPFYVSSFVESINTLYDDYAFDEYIDYLKVNVSKTDELYLKFTILDNMINKYKQSDKSDLEILNDPKWIDITLVAKGIVDSWKGGLK